MSKLEIIKQMVAEDKSIGDIYDKITDNAGEVPIATELWRYLLSKEFLEQKSGVVLLIIDGRQDYGKTDEPVFKSLADFVASDIVKYNFSLAIKVLEFLTVVGYPETNEEWIELYESSEQAELIVRFVLGYHNSQAISVPFCIEDYNRIMSCKDAVIEIAKRTESELDAIPLVYFSEMEMHLRFKPCFSTYSLYFSNIKHFSNENGEQNEVAYLLTLNMLKELSKEPNHCASLLRRYSHSIEETLKHYPIDERLEEVAPLISGDCLYELRGVGVLQIAAAQNPTDLARAIFDISYFDKAVFSRKYGRVLFSKPHEWFTDHFIDHTRMNGIILNKEVVSERVYISEENPFIFKHLKIDSVEKAIAIELIGAVRDRDLKKALIDFDVFNNAEDMSNLIRCFSFNDIIEIVPECKIDLIEEAIDVIKRNSAFYPKLTIAMAFINRANEVGGELAKKLYTKYLDAELLDSEYMFHTNSKIIRLSDLVEGFSSC